MPCLHLRQMVCQVLFAFASFLLFPSWQPQIPQFHVSSLIWASSRRYRFGSVGISPYSHLGGHAQVCHHRLHSKSLYCACDDCVILGFRRAQRTRRLRSGPVFPDCAIDHHHASTRRFPLGLFAQSESTCTSTFTSSSCFHDLITHVTFSTPFKYLPAFFSLFQLPRVGFAIFVHSQRIARPICPSS